MRPIEFVCRVDLPVSPSEISRNILDLSKWPDFGGFGILPGIRSAAFISRTENVVGTTFRVENSDGSSHVEEITHWEPERRIVLKLHHFSPPLSRIASHFIEDWRFEADGGVTHVERRFQMVPVRGWARIPLWGISLLFRRAVDHHLELMRQDAENSI